MTTVEMVSWKTSSVHWFTHTERRSNEKGLQIAGSCNKKKISFSLPLIFGPFSHSSFLLREYVINGTNTPTQAPISNPLHPPPPRTRTGITKQRTNRSIPPGAETNPPKQTPRHPYTLGKKTKRTPTTRAAAKDRTHTFPTPVLPSLPVELSVIPDIT